MANNRTEVPYISIYDHLGRSGKHIQSSALGDGTITEEVYKMATRYGIRVQTRRVETVTYTGDVMLYPKSFLEAYFGLHKAINALPASARK